MLTFTDQQNMCVEISGLSDSKAIVAFKRDLQAGTARFLSKLSRPIDRVSKVASSVSGQQYYQLPEDALRINSVVFINGSQSTPLKEVSDEPTWQKLNQSSQQSNQPSSFFVRGADEVGLYPIPSVAASNNIVLVYEPKHILLTADDYTAGTVNVTNGQQVVNGIGTTFLPKMADGSYVLQLTDGSDGNYYRINGYTAANILSIENFYQGQTNAVAAYRIGQVSKIPEEYQEAPVDYAMYRHFLTKNEMKNADYYQANWLTSLKDAEGTYGMSTGNQIVTASQATRTYNPWTDVTDNMIKV